MRAEAKPEVGLLGALAAPRIHDDELGSPLLRGQKLVPQHLRPGRVDVQTPHDGNLGDSRYRRRAGRADVAVDAPFGQVLRLAGVLALVDVVRRTPEVAPPPGCGVGGTVDRSPEDQDGLRAVVVPYAAELLGDLADGLLPGDLLPVALAPAPGSLQRVVQPAAVIVIVER